MPGSSSWRPYSLEGIKGFEDDVTNLFFLYNKCHIKRKFEFHMK